MHDLIESGIQFTRTTVYSRISKFYARYAESVIRLIVLIKLRDIVPVKHIITHGITPCAPDITAVFRYEPFKRVICYKIGIRIVDTELFSEINGRITHIIPYKVFMRIIDYRHIVVRRAEFIDRAHKQRLLTDITVGCCRPERFDRIMAVFINRLHELMSRI